MKTKIALWDFIHIISVCLFVFIFRRKKGNFVVGWLFFYDDIVLFLFIFVLNNVKIDMNAQIRPSRVK